MKGFAIDSHGDVVVKDNDVALAYDTELLIQKLRQVLATNRGEWQLNSKEGVPVGMILKKNPNPAMIRDCVRSAIHQVDASLKMIRCEVKTTGRKLTVSFSAVDGSREINTEMEV